MSVLTNEVLESRIIKVILKNGAIFKANFINDESELDAEDGIPALQVEILEVIKDNAEADLHWYDGHDVFVEFKEPEIESIEVLE
jgi:hypothetical protein